MKQTMFNLNIHGPDDEWFITAEGPISIFSDAEDHPSSLCVGHNINEVTIVISSLGKAED